MSHSCVRCGHFCDCGADSSLDCLEECIACWEEDEDEEEEDDYEDDIYGDD